MTCIWCGRECGGAAACLRCAPQQGGARAPDYDEEFQPDETYVARIVQLRALLSAYGVQPIIFAPEEPEWMDLNEARWSQSLEEQS